MNDLPTVRAEIKSWERSFRESNGRPPTVEDIKQNDVIANKYKLYKKLGKEAANSNATQSGPPSTTPQITRAKVPSTNLNYRARAVESTAPLSTFNPFSPQKKGKAIGGSIIQPKLVLNLHSSPFKKAQPRRTTVGSPDPFSPLSDPQASSSTTTPLPLTLPPLNNAVSRARKRLRGEPVSPSPSKDKRRRITSQTTLPHPCLNLEAQSSDEDDYPQEAQTSFVESSPMKPSTAGRSFSLLFEESVGPVGNLFGTKADSRYLNSEMDADPKKPSKSRNNSNRPAYKLDFTKITAGKSEELLVPGSGCEKKPPVLNTALIITSDQSVSSPRSSVKRPFSDEEMESSESQSFNRVKSPLIPPSPPPANRNPGNAQSKASARAKKRAKVDDDQDDDDTHDLDPEAKLKIVNRSGTRVPHAAELDDSRFDIDPIIGYPRSAAPRASPPQQQDDGSVEIDLPDKLRRVLALPSDTQSQVLEEDRLVKHVLYGRRIAHYDPKKGGEIWDVGEDDAVSDEQRRNFTEGEDDWEGEPVPWEIGEL